MLTFIDFCSGIGAGRLGLEKAGMKCIAHSEIDIDANNTYINFFNDNNNLGDLTKIIPEQLPDFDLLIAGFPCQTFSIVGKRKGFCDARGQIIYYLTQILKVKRVKFFILENVKGLVNHDKGNTLQTILNLLDDAGYNVQYKVINSSFFSVPQIRERVYFIGIRKDLYKKTYYFPNGDLVQNTDINNCLLENDNELPITNLGLQKYLNNKYNKDRINISEILKIDNLILDTRQSDLRIYKGVCPTLRTGRHGILYTRNHKLIKLSGLESLLLQGFPKSFLKKAQNVPNLKLLAQTGNAMTVNVIEALGKSLLQYINYGGTDE